MGSMGMMDADTMGQTGMGGAQSLDDIVNENWKAMRRRSVPVQYSADHGSMSESSMRRVSMMEFGDTSPHGQLDTYGFESPSAAMDSIIRSGNGFSKNEQSQRPADLMLNTQFPGQTPSYTSVPPGSAYASPLHQNNAMDIDMTSPYGNMGMSVGITDSNFNNLMGTDVTASNVYGSNHFESPLIGSPIHVDFKTGTESGQQPANLGVADQKEHFATPQAQSSSQDAHNSRNNSQSQSLPSNSRTQSSAFSNQSPANQGSATGQYGQEPQVRPMPPEAALAQIKFPWSTPTGMHFSIG
jgi:hypothetical protein